MEEKALDTLRTILGRRGLQTATARVRDHAYTIGDKTIVFIPGNNPSKTAIDKLLEEFPSNLIMVTTPPPIESVRAHMRNYAADGIQMFHLQQLQFDIMTHSRYGFPCRIISPDEKSILRESMRISALRQLPRVAYDDPYPLFLGALPEDVLEYEIPSEAAGFSKKYRYVVTNIDEV